MRFGETASLALGGGRVYYGTVDATPLFVMLLGELSRWGGRRDEVDALLPAADRALAWITDYGDKDGDGYVEYQRTSDRGLQNQGWKDSWDSMRFIDGTLGANRRSRCARCRATCTPRSSRGRTSRRKPATSSSRSRCAARAVELKRRFNEDFWVDDVDGGYFAMGLDRDKRPIDGIGSNMGHCLWTGIVDEEKAPAVARALTDPAMFSGWGIRTLSEAVRGYNPLSYHCGSVWPHDNAICAAGLMRYGFVDEAHRVMLGLVEASAWFGNLLPELFSGVPRGEARLPGPLSDVVLAAGVGRGVAAAVPAHDAALRARLPELEAAPRAGRSRRGSAGSASSASRVMGGHLTLEVEGEIVHALEVPDGLELVAEPRGDVPTPPRPTARYSWSITARSERYTPSGVSTPR